MERSVRLGWQLVIGVIVVCALVSAAPVLLSMASGKELRGWDVWRLFMQAVFLYYLYHGRGWARWLSIVGLVLGGLIYVTAVVAVSASIQLAWVAILFGGVFFACAGVLLSPEVREYCAYASGGWLDRRDA